MEQTGLRSARTRAQMGWLFDRKSHSSMRTLGTAIINPEGIQQLRCEVQISEVSEPNRLLIKQKQPKQSRINTTIKANRPRSDNFQR
jgi:hypothetical protein